LSDSNGTHGLDAWLLDSTANLAKKIGLLLALAEDSTHIISRLHSLNIFSTVNDCFRIALILGGTMQALFTHRYFIITLMSLLSIMSVVDLIEDRSEGASLSHMLQEGVVLALGLAVIFNLFMGIRAQTRRVQGLTNELKDASLKVAQASASLREGRLAFAKVIAEQFETWGLSKSEQEIGFLVLKGFSLAEIATLRDTKEKTVRQQASAVYKKAGVSGRHAFSAWFIEDYM
jgi:DNA-binding CsgD family transcriptional regulator